MSQRRIGRYQILEDIASGGQATVYRVWDTETGSILALKVMHPHLSRDASYVERFHREASMAASIKHPNIIRIFEVGEEDGSHFMSMEYLPDSLHSLIEAQGKLPLNRAVNIAYQLCQGLQAAHERGIIHRDIKPQNILLASDGTAKLTDFGIARAADLSTMTRTGMVMGTPHYMSPEQAKGLRVDIRSDLYSLGIVLYQMLTGELPFNAETPWEVIRLHIDAKPPSVRRAGADLPRGLVSVVDRCLEKAPDRRYQTPVSVGQAIQQSMPGAVSAPAQPRAPVAPAPPPTPPPPAAPPPRAAPPPPPPAAPARPSTTWMSSWAKAWEKTHRHRGIRIGSLITLVLGLAITAIRLGAIDEVRDFINPADTEEVTEPVVFEPVPVSAVITEGVALWNLDIPEGATTPLTFGPQGTDNLYVSNGNGVIHLLNGSDGGVRWRFNAEQPIAGAVIGPDQRLYLGTISGNLISIDPQDPEGGGLGIDLGGGNLYPAVGPEGELYAASAEGTIFRVSPEESRPLWEFSVGRQIKAPPVVGPDGTIYVGTADPGSIHAFSPDGEELWSLEIFPVPVSPAVGSLYVATDRILYTFENERNAGAGVKWQWDFESPLAPPTVARDGSVYVLNPNGLSKFSPHDGRSQWNAELNGPMGFVLGRDDRSYVLTQGGTLWEVDQDGNVNKFYDSAATWLREGPDGILYLGEPTGVIGLRPAVVVEEEPVLVAGPIAVPSADLIAWWPGEGNSNDIVGGNHGTLQNGVTFAPGIIGQAFSFDGDSYVDIGDIADFEITSTSSMSITGWLYNFAPVADQYIISKADIESPDFGWFIRLKNDSLIFNIANNDVQARIDIPGVSDDLWYHFAATHDGSIGRMNLYVDGVLRGSETENFGPIDDGGMPLTIGISSQGSGAFSGLIDEVAIFNGALSASEIKGMYDAGSAGLAASTPATSGPTYGGTLRVGMLANHATFDPPLVRQGNPSDIVTVQHTYDPLVMRNPDLSLQPMLATSWESNADATQWTFNLRRGVKFHHGKEFKVEDVVFTFNRLFEVESQLASVMTRPKIDALDDYTVRFIFESPNAVLLDSLVKYQALITPSDVDPARFATETLGTGPFIMTEHAVGDGTNFKRNPNYWWEGHPLVDRLVYIYPPSREALAGALRDGDIEVIYDLDIASVPGLEADPDTQVAVAPSGGYMNLVMDVRVPPFDNILVRKALQAVTDREAILQAAHFGLGGIAYDHPVAESDPLFNPSCKPPEYDPDLAKRLLGEAGYPNGIDLTLFTSPAGANMVEMAKVFQEKAAAAGINIEVAVVGEGEYWSDVWLVEPFYTSWWSGRPPYEAFSVVYPSGAAWNEA